MKHLQYKCNSIGYVSEYLTRVAKSASKVSDLPISSENISILADEVFICNTPILVIIDAISHVILAIEISKSRTGEDWQQCFMSLINKGYNLNVVAKDLGKGLAKGLNLVNEKERLQVVHQADLFHLLMRFRAPLGSLQKKAYGAIEEEDRRLKVLDNRVTQDAITKQTELSLSAIDNCNYRISQFDDYVYLYKQLHEAFNPFNEDGSFRTQNVIDEDIVTILSLMKEVFKSEKIKGAISFLEKNIVQYYPFIQSMCKTLSKFSKLMPNSLIKEVCLGYQKGLKSIAIKNYHLAKDIGIQAKEHLQLARMVTENEKELALVESLYKSLTKNVRSSSALEAKNSVLRQYFNSFSNQITQETLNLIAGYLNYKVAKRGKYKGFSPVERMNGEKSTKNILELFYTA